MSLAMAALACACARAEDLDGVAGEDAAGPRPAVGDARAPGGADAGQLACKPALRAMGDVARTLSSGGQDTLQVLLEDGCSGPIAGARVDFYVIGDPLDLELAASASQTDAAGRAATTVRAGSRAGIVVVWAEARGQAVKTAFALTIRSIAGTDDAIVASHTLPTSMACGSTVTATVTFTNTGSASWYRAGLDGYKLGYVDDLANPFLPDGQAPRALMAEGQTVPPGASVSFGVELRAPPVAGEYPVRLRMVHERVRWFGAATSQGVSVTCGDGGGTGDGCGFPQGVPDDGWIGTAESWSDTDPAVDQAVTEVMVELTGCPPGSDCRVGDGDNPHLVCQDWFARVNQRLRQRGLCAGLHVEGHTDEIAVSNTGCRGRWYGYHICSYGGMSVVWMPGARRGWWQIAPASCP
jgi:hypothetical protein